MLLKNYENNREYNVTGPIYENDVTKIWCGTCKIFDNKDAFVKILNYGEITDEKVKKEMTEVSRQEANTLRKIRHCSSRIPSFIDEWNDEKKKQYVIIMSKVPGMSLREWMETHQKERLEAKDICVRAKIVQQICEIMRDLTSKNAWLVHRDLKPENIYIDFNKKEKKWNVYIIDFGCANLNHIRNAGTANYQAPEQIGVKDLGVKIMSAADMFAIGQIFYELLLGRVPVIGEDYTYKAKEAEWKQIPKMPDYLSDIKGFEALTDIIRKMTGFKPEERITFARAIVFLKNVRIG